MVCAWYLKEDAVFQKCLNGEQSPSARGPQSITLPAVADLEGAFSWRPHTKTYYKCIFGVDHNSYLKCIKCSSEQSNGLNYFPQMIFFSRIQ